MKLNDLCEFPMQLDMWPYTKEALSPGASVEAPVGGQVAPLFVWPPMEMGSQRLSSNRVLSAPAGSDPAGLGGNPASLLNSGAASA